MQNTYLFFFASFAATLSSATEKVTLNRGNDSESFASINLESILLRVLNEVILLSLNKGH